MKIISALVKKIKANKLELTVIGVLLLVVGIVHAVNMFHYPYYEDDEGTYMAQAWSFATHAKLAPYTYWYDHAPLGWMLIALWLKLTGGAFTFGFSINSGRVLIFILFIFSSLFVYLIGRKLTNSKAMATLSVALFALTPLTLALQRRVLLDNIMVFWLLASIVVILYSRQRLSHIILAGFLFGISVLTKESAGFFFPAMIYLVYLYSGKTIRKLSITLFVLTSCLFIFLYPLMAIVKGELLPATGANCSSSHVSLIGTLEYQASRGAGGLKATVWPVFKSWLVGGGAAGLNYDPLILISGIISLFAMLIIGIWRRPALALSFLGLSYLLFLIRGGEIIYFYIIPFVPFLALATAYAMWFISNMITRKKFINYLPYVFFVVLTVFIWTTHNFKQFQNTLTVDQTIPQIESVSWMLSQNTPGSFYAIDMYAYVDLHAKNKNNFGHAEYYWKVADDPGVFNKVLNENYKNINYIVETPQVEIDTVRSNLYLMHQALDNSQEVTSFSNDGGWNVIIYKVNDKDPSKGHINPPANLCI